MKLKEHFLFEEIQKICVSSLSDGLVVVRLPTEGPENRVRRLCRVQRGSSIDPFLRHRNCPKPPLFSLQGDLILETDHLVEFVTKLSLYAEKLEQVQIVDSGM